MQESKVGNLGGISRLPGIIVPVILLGIVAIFSPIAYLETTETPPSDPPPPGWNTSVTIYLWVARFSSAYFQNMYGLGDGVTNLHTTPFIVLTIIYVIIHFVVNMRRMKPKYGAGLGVVLFLIWVSICQLIYGTLQDWALIQIPILPLIGCCILFIGYLNQHASSS
ncbi:MAG: hypothetical protein ACFFE2_10060 [Candidatus Thorarchaeota archaeon]